MIFQFRLISDEVKDFARELVIDSNQSFLDFHKAIQKNLGYDPHQLASFFITNNAWEKMEQITLIDMEDTEGGNTLTMENAILKDYINPDGQRMLYVFDFFSERSFFIELTEVLKGKISSTLPKITYAHGDPPVQINLGMDDLSVDNYTDPEEFDDEFDDTEFTDDFDLDGLEDLTDE